MQRPVIILWTCRNLAEAKEIARALLNERLIACASIVPQVESLFSWQGKIETAEECKVFLKTDARQFGPVKEKILSLCSYEVPEILQLEISRGNPAYLSWLGGVVTRRDRRFSGLFWKV